MGREDPLPILLHEDVVLFGGSSGVRDSTFRIQNSRGSYSHPFLGLSYNSPHKEEGPEYLQLAVSKIYTLKEEAELQVYHYYHSSVSNFPTIDPLPLIRPDKKIPAHPPHVLDHAEQ